MFAKSLTVFAVVASIISAQSSARNAVLDALATVPALSTLKSILTSDDFVALTKGAPFTGNFTVFAPSDDAFDRAGYLGTDIELITAILTYHILPATVPSSAITESPVFVKSVSENPKYVNLPEKTAQTVGAFKTCKGVYVIDGTYVEGTDYPRVTQADIKVGSGVVHIIDKVMTLPQAFSTVLKANPRYSTLTSLLNNTNSLDALDGLVGATLFAPSNAAFSPIITAPTQPTTEQITTVLYGHVVNGAAVTSDQITDKAIAAPTLNKDKTISVVLDDGAVKAGDATVIAANVLTKNGVLHRVNKVITVA